MPRPDTHTPRASRSPAGSPEPPLGAGLGGFGAPRGSVVRSHARGPRPLPLQRRARPGEGPARPWVFHAIGTRWSIETADRLSRRTAGRIATLVEEFDRTFSRFRADSLVARMSAGEGIVEIPASGQALLDFYRDLYDSTDGAVTPLVGESLDQLGYDASYTLQRRGPSRPAPAWDDVMDWDGCTLQTRGPVTLDLGAAGKGRLVDLVARGTVGRRTCRVHRRRQRGSRAQRARPGARRIGASQRSTDGDRRRAGPQRCPCSLRREPSNVGRRAPPRDRSRGGGTGWWHLGDLGQRRVRDGGRRAGDRVVPPAGQA